MKNKKVKRSLYSVWCDVYGKHVDSGCKKMYDWAFDRLRLFEMNMDRSKLRHPEVSKVSLTADQLKEVK